MTLRFLYGIVGSVVFHVLFVVFAPDVVLPKMSMPEYKKHEVSFVNRHLQLPNALIHKPVPEVPRPKFLPIVKKFKIPKRPNLLDLNSLPKVRPPKLPLRPTLANVESIPTVKRPEIPSKPGNPKSLPEIPLPKYPSEVVSMKNFPKVPLPKRNYGNEKLRTVKRRKIAQSENKSKIMISSKIKFSDLFISEKAKLILNRRNEISNSVKKNLDGRQFIAKSKNTYNSVNEIDIDKYLKLSQENLKRKNIVIVDSPIRKEMDKRNRRLLFSPPLPEINSLQMPTTVVLKFWVLSDGSVGRILVEKKANTELEVSAINHLKRWKFNSLSFRYRSKEQWGIVAYRFLVN